MRGKTDMSGVSEQGTFTLLPEEKFKVEIVEVTGKETKNGDPILNVKFAVSDGQYKDCFVWDNIIISDNPESPGYNILGRSKHFLHCINEPYDNVKGESLKWDSDNWIGRMCIIKIKHELPNEHHSYTKALVSNYILDENKSIDLGDAPEL